MSAVPVPIRMTVEEYYRLEERSEQKHEFWDGVRVAMAGGTLDHARIAANVVREVGNGLKKRPCAVLGSDLRVRLERRGRIFYPDATIVCGEAQLDVLRDGKPGTSVVNPRALVEVLSESTAEFDRREKFDVYREFESFEEYVLISQDTPRVETFRRHPDGSWRFQAFVGLEETLQIESVGVSVALREIYDGVVFPVRAEVGEAAEA